jgi:hypothetical protein
MVCLDMAAMFHLDSTRSALIGRDVFGCVQPWGREVASS